MSRLKRVRLGKIFADHLTFEGALARIQDLEDFAQATRLIGDFNGWNEQAHPLKVRWDSSGIWEGFVAGLSQGEKYKYHVRSRHRGYRVDKTDPFAFFSELSPQTASVVWDLSYDWGDGEWMETRSGRLKTATT